MINSNKNKHTYSQATTETRGKISKVDGHLQYLAYARATLMNEYTSGTEDLYACALIQVYHSTIISWLAS